MGVIPDPNDPTTSDAYVDLDGVVRVQAGLDAPSTAVGVVGFVPGMCMLWKGLAADKPKGWVIESAPAGSYLKIASADGEMGVSGGAASVTIADHVHTGAAHTHNHSHNMAHTHLMGDHAHDNDHNHGSFFSGTKDHTFEQVLADGSGRDRDHDHLIDVPNYTGVTSNNGALTNTQASSATNTSNDNTAASAANTGGVVTTPLLVALTPLFYGLYIIRYTGAP